MTAKQIGMEIRALCEVEEKARTLVDALETNEFHTVTRAAGDLTQSLDWLEKTRSDASSPSRDPRKPSSF